MTRRPRRLTLALACLALAGCGRDTSRLELLVSTEEPASTIAAAMAPLLSAAGVELIVTETATPAEALDAIAAGDADLAIVEEPLRMQSGLATVVPLYPSVLHVLHRADAEPADFSELVVGRSVYAGPTGTAGRRLLADLSRDFGIATDRYTLLDNPWSVEPDVYFIFGGLLGKESVASLAGYRLYGFGDPSRLGSGTVAEGIALAYPNKRAFVLPEALYGPLSAEPVLTIATRSVLLGAEHLDDAVVYSVARQLVEHAQELAADYPLVTLELKADFDPSALALPLHPGARRFMNRDAPTFLERYVDVIALGFTLIAALGSGLVALYRRRQQLKKDRVDVYYRQILDLRHGIRPGQSRAELLATAEAVRAVQEEVFSLLIDERVNADGTLTIFLDLSNQVLKEIEQAASA